MNPGLDPGLENRVRLRKNIIQAVASGSCEGECEHDTEIKDDRFPVFTRAAAEEREVVHERPCHENIEE